MKKKLGLVVSVFTPFLGLGIATLIDSRLQETGWVLLIPAGMVSVFLAFLFWSLLKYGRGTHHEEGGGA